MSKLAHRNRERERDRETERERDRETERERQRERETERQRQREMMNAKKYLAAYVALRRWRLIVSAQLPNKFGASPSRTIVYIVLTIRKHTQQLTNLGRCEPSSV